MCTAMSQPTNQGVMNSSVGNAHFYYAGDKSTQSKSNNCCFISHTSEDKPLVELIKNAIQTLVNPDFVVFVDTDADSIKPGRKWSDQIREALQQSSHFIVIISQHSLNRQWINVEIGAAWGAGVNILPVCYGKITSEELSTPLSEYQDIHLEDIQDNSAMVSFIERIMHFFDIKNISLAKVRNFLKYHEISKV